MNRSSVASSNIKSIGFEQAEVLLGNLSKEKLNTGTLEVEFVGGNVYTYKGVPKTLYEGLMAAESKGRYFSANIRSGFTGVRVLPEKKEKI